MSRRLRFSLLGLVVLAVLFGTFEAGLTDAFGTGKDLHADGPLWVSDGAQSDTFWDSQVVDLPGFSLYEVHCHGAARLDLQVGATGPDYNNPCYAAFGDYGNGSSNSGVYWISPDGTEEIWRSSENNGPWNYGYGPTDPG